MLRVVVLAAALYGIASASTPPEPLRIDTLAGSNSNGDGGPATAAVFQNLEGVAADPLGNVFVADTDAHVVRRISPSGVVRTVAGNGRAGLSGDGGQGPLASLNLPYGLAADLAGNLYIADLGNARIRKLSPDGIITTIAGHTADTRLAAPRNVAVDAAGAVYISDFGGHRIYKLTGAVMTPIAGNGRQGVSDENLPALTSVVNSPAGIAVDLQGNVYFGETGNKRVRKLSQGYLSTIGGPPKAGADPVLGARLPTGVAVNYAGELYVACPETRRVYVVNTGGLVDQVALAARDVALDSQGNAFAVFTGSAFRITGTRVELFGGGNPARFSGDGGPALQARLNRPIGLARDASGNLYFTDSRNQRIRRIAMNGTIDTVVDGLNNAQGLAVNAKGWIYAADTGSNKIRLWKPDKSFTIVAGGASAGFSGDGGPATLARLNAPSGVALDSAGNVYISDEGNNRLRMVDTNGVIRTVAELKSPGGLFFDELRGLYVAETGNAQIRRITRNGAIEVAAAFDSTVRPRGVAVAADGTIYTTDVAGHRVLMVSPEGVVFPAAGTGKAGFSGEGTLALTAELEEPSGILIAGNAIHVADTGSHRLRSLTRAGDIVAPIVEPIVIENSALWNAATRAPAAVAPGGLYIVPNLVNAMEMEILLNGEKIRPVLYSSSEVTIQAPVGLEPGSTLEILATQEGQVRLRSQAGVVDAAPGLYSTVVNSDGTVNSADAPASRGAAVTLFVTGEGRSAALDEGGVVRVLIAGRSSEVLYAGPSGIAGVFQINAVVPSGYFPNGSHPVAVEVNRKLTQPGVNVVVR